MATDVVTNRMQWDRLLCSQRLGQESVRGSLPSETDPRTEFQKDMDRIVFSSAFRRMQGKTQVHPFPNSDYIHTRLTHSIEVASVGRSLGTIAGNAILQRNPALAYTPADFGDIVSAACIAHDIGNPPFGHAGEEAIREWFRDHPDVMEGLTEAQQCDFLKFEGNAQGFRTIATLQNWKNEGGMQLTYAMLGAFTKYPRSSAPSILAMPGDKGAAKFGFFQAEADCFSRIAAELDLMKRQDNPAYWARHPLAYLVEAADDICYRIIDLEDGYKLKKLGFEETESLLLDLIGEQRIGRYSLLQARERDKRISYLRATAIGILVEAAAQCFLSHESAILAGAFQGDLLSHLPQFQQLERIRHITADQVFQSPEIIEIQIAGFDIIGGLLDALIYAQINLAQAERRATYKDEMLLTILNHFDPDPPQSRYELLLKATDYISGMTDSFAIDLYKRIQGVSF